MSHQDLIGKPAPTVTLLDQDGQPFTIAPGQKGIPIAIFFYPQSGSYGCTKQACQFRDAIAEKDTFGPGRVQIIGISRDPVAKQKQFVEDQKLTYPVLSDEKGEAVTLYNVGRGMFGLVGVARVTFVIDKKGIVRDALDATMNYGQHAPFVSKWLDKFDEEEKEAAARG
ncbi:hypothetical protein AX16_008409 [Volvariella volvacea WC 439]|nr:hypothetical protein AX16_008409 [Volvariella volvacea WC 439]